VGRLYQNEGEKKIEKSNQKKKERNLDKVCAKAALEAIRVGRRRWTKQNLHPWLRWEMMELDRFKWESGGKEELAKQKIGKKQRFGSQKYQRKNKVTR